MVKKLTKNIEKIENDFTHSPFIPVDVRNEKSFYIEVDNSKYDIWSYSPYGYTVLDPDEKLMKGTHIKLNTYIQNDLGKYDGYVVGSENKKSLKTTSIRSFSSEKRDEFYKNERGAKRWSCPKEYLPTGTMPNPFTYGDMIFFRIDEISFGGFSFETSMRNKFIQRGMRFDSTIILPSIGTINCSFIVKHISIRLVSDKEMLFVGVSFVEKEEVFRRSIAEYLIMFGDGVSLQSLKADGFEIKEISKFLDFSYVKTLVDYESVLNLRLISYKNAKKISTDSNMDDVADEFDDRSRILMVKYKNILVGTARFMYSDLIEDSYYASVGDLNEFPYSVLDCVEIASVCLEDLSRGGDIFYQIFSHAILSTIKSNRRYIIAGTTDTLLKFYLDCGFVKTNLSYKSKKLNGLQHDLIVMDTYKVALGHHVKLKRWCQLYAGVVDFMIDKEYLTPTRREILKINSSKRIGRFLGYLK